MFLRFGMLWLASFICGVSHAQKDSVLLDPVTIYGLPDERYLVGSQVVSVDSTLLHQQATRHLDEVLAFQFPIYFRTYGNGMSSGISMRGTSPQHVAVLWNGININSFSLGQTDFSILPSVAFEDVKLHVGAGSARFGSGAFGGSLLLSSSGPVSRQVMLSQEIGSFGRYGATFKGSADIGDLGITTTFYHVRADNDFPLPNTRERQQHAAYRQTGIVQHLQYNFSPAKQLKLDYWYHQAFRELQPTISSAMASDTQGDRNHRLRVEYQQHSRAGTIKVGGGLVDDVITFNDVPGEVLRWIGNASHEYRFSNQLNLSLQANWNHIIGKINEYGSEPPDEDRLDFSGGLQRNFGRVSLAANLRKPFVTGLTTPLLPYLGASIDLLSSSDQSLILKTNVSRNFRAPTFNDRYWLDAGNPDLKPEHSHAAELGVSWQRGFMNLGGTFYGQDVDDWIQWVPDDRGAYRPRNIKRVQVLGTELQLKAHHQIGLVALHACASYGYVRSTTREVNGLNQSDVGKQLIYTPMHTATAILRGGYRGWSTSLQGQFTGKRYTEASNNDAFALDPFALVDLTVAKVVRFDRQTLEVLITVKNLFDVEYQLFSGRAMPGSNFEIRATYQLTPKQKP